MQPDNPSDPRHDLLADFLTLPFSTDADGRHTLTIDEYLVVATPGPLDQVAPVTLRSGGSEIRLELNGDDLDELVNIVIQIALGDMTWDFIVDAFRDTDPVEAFRLLWARLGGQV